MIKCLNFNDLFQISLDSSISTLKKKHFFSNTENSLEYVADHFSIQN